MASLVVTQGLQRLGVQASQATSGSGPTYSATRHVQTLYVDDQTSAFLATDLDLDRNGTLTVTNHFDQAVSGNTRTGQTVAHQTIIPTGQGNFTVRRLSLHDDNVTNVTVSSDTLVAGVDGQALAKTSDFTMTPVLNLLYTNI